MPLGIGSPVLRPEAVRKRLQKLEEYLNILAGSRASALAYLGTGD